MTTRGRAGAILIAAWSVGVGGGCRRAEPVPAPPATQPAPVPAATQAVAPAGPTFENTPEGAARKFLYAWNRGDEALLRESILPDARWRRLFALGWVATDEALRRILNDPVREFHPGDAFPVGLPGQPKQMRIVGEEGLGPDRKLLMLIERGLIVVRREGRWRVDAGPILDGFERTERPGGTPAATQPAETGG